MTLGLYNSYDRVRFAEAHRRAIARSAPVALAFDANLATFGFPYAKDLATPAEIATWVSGATAAPPAGPRRPSGVPPRSTPRNEGSPPNSVSRSSRRPGRTRRRPQTR